MILSPQWIIDSITYIIRDIQLHRFGRDRKAKELQDGAAWLSLVQRGTLTESLLDRLWIDRREHRDFLLQLMRKLGLFAELPIRMDTGERRYFVPSTVSAVISRRSDGGDGIGGGGGGGVGGVGGGGHKLAASRHLGLWGCCAATKPSDPPNPPFEALERLAPQPVCVSWLSRRSTGCTEPDAQPLTFSFDFRGFLPNGFFERVVNRLVSDWPGGYTRNDPHILWNAAELCVSDPKYRLVLIVDKEAHTITAVVAAEHASRIIPHLQYVANKVNEEFYAGRINFESDGGVEQTLRGFKPQETPSLLASTTGSDSERLKRLETDQDFCELRTFFVGCGVSPDDAVAYAELGRDEALSGLRRMHAAWTEAWTPHAWCEGGEADFRQELAETFGVGGNLKGKRHQNLIIKELARMDRPHDIEKFLIGYFGGDDLIHVQRESTQIARALKRENLLADFRFLGTAAHLHSGLGACTPSAKHRVLHLAMHGHKPTRAGKHTLAFSDEEPSEPELLAEAIANGCIHDGGNERGCISCVFINACFGSDIGERLNCDHHVPWVVTWTTSVDDEAAQVFAEEFYATLSKTGHNCPDFRSAFERAKWELRLNQWVIDDDGGDPSLEEALLARQRRENNLKLKAAGIPKLYECASNRSPLASESHPQSHHERSHASSAHGASSHIASTPGAPRAPWLTPPKEYHFFICHHQGSGGDQAHLLCDALRSRGYKVWYDNGVKSDARNLGGMQRGVRSSACLLLLLTGRKENAAGVSDSSGVYEGPFTRWYCHQEMETARSERLPVIGVMEVEERYNKADLAEEKRRARTGGANGGPISEHAENILALLDGPNSVVFLPFRRQQHEMEAMLAEICLQFVSKVVNSAQTGNSPWDRSYSPWDR